MSTPAELVICRRRGIGRKLTEALRELARERGCYGMWVGTEGGFPQRRPAPSRINW